MKLTPNKLHLGLGIAMILIGLACMMTAFLAHGRRYGNFSIGAIGPMGILMVIAGAALVFSPPKPK